MKYRPISKQPFPSIKYIEFVVEFEKSRVTQYSVHFQRIEIQLKKIAFDIQSCNNRVADSVASCDGTCKKYATFSLDKKILLPSSPRKFKRRIPATDTKIYTFLYLEKLLSL